MTNHRQKLKTIVKMERNCQRAAKPPKVRVPVMSKFKVLRYNQVFMTKLGIYSQRLTASAIDFFKSLITLSILILLLLAIILSAVFVYKHRLESKRTLESMSLIVTSIQAFGAYLNIGLRMAKVAELHLKLQAIADEALVRSKLEPNVFVNYWKIELKCRKVTKITAKFIVIHQFTYVATFIYSLVCVFVGNIDTRTWPLLFNFSLPFDPTSIFGWYLLWFIQCHVDLSYALSMISATTYFICCCFYIHAICDDFNFVVDSVVENVERNNTETNPRKFRENYCNVVRGLRDAVGIHLKVFDVFDAVSDINNGTIFSVIPLNAALMFIIMFNMEHLPDSFGLMYVLNDLGFTICSLFWPSVFCYFATLTADRISSVGNVVYNSNWYDFPPKLQQSIKLIIARSQRSTHFNGFNLFACNLRTFGNLFKYSMYFYLTIRLFAEK